jgi:hypothetical protein
LSDSGAHAVFTRNHGAITLTIGPEGAKMRSARN